MQTNIVNTSVLNPIKQQNNNVGFQSSNPLLKNKQKLDEFELEKNLDTKEGQIAFLEYHLKKAKGSQGFIARGFNKLKGWTGLGLSSKKLDDEIKSFIDGQIPFEKVCEDINKFKYNQKEATDILVDTVGAAVSFTLSHAGTNFGNAVNAFLPFKKLLSSSKLPKTLSTLSTLLISLLSGNLKATTKFIDSFGMEKSQRKENRHFFKDFLTGTTTGVCGVLPGVVGTQPIPMIGSIMGGMALNSGIRYLTLPKEDKSFGDFCRQQIENPGVKLFATAALGTLAACNYKNLSQWNDVSAKMQHSIKDTEEYNQSSCETIFEKLAGDKGLNIFDTNDNKSLGYILSECAKKGMSSQETLKEIEKANMFYPKYLQTLTNSFILSAFGQKCIKEYPNLPKIIELVKSECTGERSAEDAQKYIDDTFGAKKYTIIKPKDKNGNEMEAKPLGVGSVAETWSVKDKDGKEYVIKMVKDGVSKENLEKQKKYLTDKLNHISDEKERTAQVKALEQLFATWEKELDLKAESDSAIQLANCVKTAKVVKPIKTNKEGTAYVMEKAQGELFSNVFDFMGLEYDLCITTGFEYDTKSECIKNEYNKVYLEQIFGVPKSGEKIMHADPHAGNIFVDYKDNKAQFTFIDTGNVIHMSSEDAVKNMFNHLNYYIGNTEAIAELLLKNAKYPNNLNEEKAKQELKKYLDENIYNDKTTISNGVFNIVDTAALAWMQSKGIIADPNQANLHKAESTYTANNNNLKKSSPIFKIQSTFPILSELNPKDDDFDQKKQKFIKQEWKEDQKRQLSTIFMEEYDICIKKLKNIKKLINTPSFVEGKKSEILHKTYLDTIKAIKAISICDNNESQTTRLLTQTNAITKEIFEDIQKYNNSLVESDNKKYAQMAYKHFNEMFDLTSKKSIANIKFTFSVDCKTASPYTFNDTEKGREFIFEYYINNRYKYSTKFEEYYYKDKQKKYVDESLEIKRKLNNNYRAKDTEQNKKYFEEQRRLQEDQKEFMKNALNENSETLKTIFSCPWNHPHASIKEIKQLKRYLDKNKEHAMKTLRLTTGMERAWQIMDYINSTSSDT